MLPFFRMRIPREKFAYAILKMQKKPFTVLLTFFLDSANNLGPFQKYDHRQTEEHSSPGYGGIRNIVILCEYIRQYCVFYPLHGIA